MSSTTLDDAIDRLARAQLLSEVQEIVRTAARQIVNADGATFVLRDDDKCFYADEDAMSPLWKGQRFAITECISGWAMLHARPAVIPDITQDPRIPQDAYRPTFVRSLAMVPIGTDAPIGAIGAYWARNYEATADDLDLMNHLAAATASVMRRVGIDDAPFTPSSIG